MLQLPAELNLMIVRQLSREDLFSLFFVCKELKAFIHPLFYEHLLYTSMGFAFPHAPNAYPFLDIPNLRVRDPVSAEEREDIMKRVRSITIARHNHEDCAGWPKFQEHGSLEAKAELLSIELAGPSPDGIAECHERVWPPDCDICEDDPDHRYSHENIGHPFPTCAFVESLGKSTAETIVIKNYPILSDGVRPDFLCEVINSASHFVILLEPHFFKVSQFSDTYDYLYFDEYPEDDCPYGFRAVKTLLSIIPPDAKDVTLIFKTRSPEIEWAPDCIHYGSRGDWHDDGCSQCACSCDSDGWDRCSETKSAKQRSCWQSSVLSKLASGIAASKARFTLVNYSSIIPDGAERDKALRALKSGKRITVRKKLARELRKACKSQEDFEARLADVRFVSMESWICSGAWEDIFERKELDAWFEHIAEKKEAMEAAATKESKLASAAEGKEDAIVETVMKEQPKLVSAAEEKEEAAVESAAPPKSTESAAV
ncbi:hypothetical protein A1Q1_03462 [Trichosporon asahii var. asahii CBS 2479]|uniref:F-box domain-containing protein n=1 Tax=Trichosporon asahii var. asahii (strain ATCC 90039 / CBS 2479 / JCM 2466 / KCTC 7840 / NBRC 103889/ NCYC 2677 / UAMH 7654) TaxID=1186058 RepID=J4UAC5_TRIAS|nr:hypothetical protein A1Q1_03462 [Trichosporon asahii var. asahii CBS 2479]EJT47685.1 hypothetical protein A1Q1_03462 [Trichosporon asahii var. asahii CBS 2479]